MSNIESLPIINEEKKGDDPRVSFAIERTAYALERTQLAWIRTTLAFLGGGVALDKGMEAIHKARIISGKALFDSAHIIGIFLSSGATLFMLLSTWFCYKRFHNLSEKQVTPHVYYPVMLSSALTLLLGIVISVLLIIS